MLWINGTCKLIYEVTYEIGRCPTYLADITGLSSHDVSYIYRVIPTKDAKSTILKRDVWPLGLRYDTGAISCWHLVLWGTISNTVQQVFEFCWKGGRFSWLGFGGRDYVWPVWLVWHIRPLTFAARLLRHSFYKQVIQGHWGVHKDAQNSRKLSISMKSRLGQPRYNR